MHKIRTSNDKTKFQQLEVSLQESLRSKRQEVDELRGKLEEQVKQVEDLERRLNNQTAEVIRLTEELENYEYED